MSDIEDKLMAKKETGKKRQTIKRQGRQIKGIKRQPEEEKPTFNWGSRGRRKGQRARICMGTNHS